MNYLLYSSFLSSTGDAQPIDLNVAPEYSTLICLFATTFVSSGILLGVLYVFVASALKINRQDVENWLERQRQRLASGPVPLIEKAQPVMASALGSVYGFSAGRRFNTSLIVGAVVTLFGCGLVWSHYYHMKPELEALKRQVEIETDPKLYKYFTDPILRPEYDKAFQNRDGILGEFYNTGFIFEGELYDELRRKKKDFNAKATAKLSAHPERVPLALLLLFEGTYLRPGFRWVGLLSLFGFNVLLDFISVTLVARSLTTLGHRPTLGNAIRLFGLTAVALILLAGVALLSYTGFFRGNIGFFSQLLFILPLSILGVIVSILMLASVMIFTLPNGEKSRETKKPPRIRRYPRIERSCFLALALLPLSWFGLRHVWSYWKDMSLPILSWQDLTSFPYALAGTTLLPASLIILVFRPFAVSCGKRLGRG